MCEVREQLQRKLEEASRQFALADKDSQTAPSKKNSFELMASKAGEVKQGAEAALQHHVMECPACQS